MVFMIMLGYDPAQPSARLPAFSCPRQPEKFKVARRPEERKKKTTLLECFSRLCIETSFYCSGRCPNLTLTKIDEGWTVETPEKLVRSSGCSKGCCVINQQNLSQS